MYIDAGLLQRLPDLCAKHLAGRRIAVISDDTVAHALSTPTAAARITFPAGEASKSRETWSRLTDELIARGFGRDSAIVSLGGGVTGDIAGFVAATYLRGIPWLQVPTTLLAMLDASVGGKTGVDTPGGKNLVGAFHQPAAVVMDPEVLASLSHTELRNGLAEAVKHAAIRDSDHFAWLDANVAQILALDPGSIGALLRHNVAIKVDVVQRDEREGGLRAILNAGHTVGHAIEHASGFSISHGESVAVGLVAEARIGEQLGVTARGTTALLSSLFERLGLPVGIPRNVDRNAILAALRNDKKNRANEIRLVLLTRLGAVHGSDTSGWTVPVPETVLKEVLQAT